MILESSSKNSKLLLVIFGLVLLLGSLIFIYTNFFKKSAGISCTMEAKLCSDGSSVGRVGPNCEFAPCPSETFAEFGNEQVEKAIIGYLLNQQYFSWKTQADSHNFCVIKNILPNNNLFPLYIWAYCSEYIMEKDKLKQLSGFFGRAKINYPNELSFYDQSKFSYEVPRDGSYQDEDIKRIFPPEGQIGISSADREEMVRRIENLAVTNIQSWEKIKQAINNCEVKKAFQAHSREVSVDLKNGEELKAIEPKIDDIFDIISEVKDRCGSFPMATE
ncbi:MAG TPA: hypothetical protein P5089_02495 [Candidatus Portnoybacteria bacterium]|nr:hypothetical protein [Candidatus Portnoybacteria bacterium]